jgi:succinoglycan biosynthesis transport protein ExoP
MNTTGRSLSRPDGYERLLPVIPGDSSLFTRDLAYEDEGQGELIDLKTIWSAFYRNRYLILAVMAIALALGVVSLYMAQPMYRASSSVEIDQAQAKVLGTEDPEPYSSSWDADRFLQTQIDVLKSRGLAARVVDNLKLANDDRFLVAMGIQPQPGVRRDQVVGALLGNLQVELPEKSRVVPIAFVSPNPKVAATVANAYAENFIASNLQRRFDTSTYSRNFLQNQLNLTKTRLEASERALLAYARSVGIVDPNAGPGEALTPTGASASSGGGTRSLTSANLLQLNQALAAAQSARIDAQQRWQQSQGANVMTLPEVLSNQSIQAMSQKRAELESDYQQELQHRKPDHPAVQQAAAALKELDRQIAMMASSIRTSIQNQYMTAQRQESALAGTVNDLKGATLSEQNLGIRYNILKREVDTNRQLYDGLLQRFKEVSAQAGITNNNISIIDRAETPLGPFSPNPMVNMALAFIGGLVVAVGLVAAREMFDDAVRSPDEVEQRFGLPFLGAVPRLGRRVAATSALMDPRSEMSEAYHTVRASIDLSSENGSPGTLLITSSREGEGKSTTALAMARDFAHSGKRVLLIDADLRRPSLHGVLNLEKTPGLSNLLTKQLSLEEVVQHTDTERLDFISAGPQPPSPAELLSGTRFASLLTSLKSRYDQIVIDSPPVLGLADAPQMAAVVDGAVLVVEANRAHRGAVKAALRRLVGARAQLLGAILVKFDPRKVGFGADYMTSYYGYGNSDEIDEDLARLGSGGRDEPSEPEGDRAIA